MVNVEEYLHSLKQRNNKNSQLFQIPKGDKGPDIPHIKNNISQENYMHQGDILYLPTSQFGFKYALVICDIATSKVDAVPLKELNSTAVVNGLKTIYDTQKILKYPMIIQFDSGTEFKNKSIKAFFKDKNIPVRYTKTNRHRQNSVIEARNKYLGQLILRFQAEKELETKRKTTAWHTDLHKYIAFMNEKIKPTKKLDMLGDAVGNKHSLEVLDTDTKVRKILDYPIRADNGKKISGQFRTGDLRFSEETYVIKHVILNPNMPPLYMLNKDDDVDKLDTSVAYTRNQLLLVK